MSPTGKTGLRKLGLANTMSATLSPGGMPLDPRHSQSIGNLICMASMAVWAAGFPAAEVLLKTWDPLALIAARFCLSVLVLVVAWAAVEGGRAVLAAPWLKGARIGGLAFGLGAWLLLVAQAATDAVTVSIIAAAVPIAAVLIEIVTEGRRLNRRLGAGLLASVVGGIIASGLGSGGGGLSASALWGVGAAVLSCFLFAWGSHRSVSGLPDLSALGRTTVTLAGGLVVTGVLFLAAHMLGLVPLPKGVMQGHTPMLLAIYAIGGMALSQLLWIISVARLGVGLASFHINVAPFYVMLIFLALGQGWSWPQAIGAAIVALGVIVAQR